MQSAGMGAGGGVIGELVRRLEFAWGEADPAGLDSLRGLAAAAPSGHDVERTEMTIVWVRDWLIPARLRIAGLPSSATGLDVLTARRDCARRLGDEVARGFGLTAADLSISMCIDAIGDAGAMPDAPGDSTIDGLLHSDLELCSAAGAVYALTRPTAREIAGSLAGDRGLSWDNDAVELSALYGIARKKAQPFAEALNSDTRSMWISLIAELAQVGRIR